MKILLASSIDPAAIEALERDHDVVRAINAPEDELAELVRDREAIVFRSGVMISARVLEQRPNWPSWSRPARAWENSTLPRPPRPAWRSAGCPAPPRSRSRR